jgi:replicative DNA helicase
VLPEYFLDSTNRQIAEIAHKLPEKTIELVRTAINQDKKNLFKSKLHERLNLIENEVYSYYPDMTTELQDLWKNSQVKQYSQKLAQIGTEYCTLQDAQSHVERLSDVLTHGSTHEAIKSFLELSESILAREKEDIDKQHLHLTKPIISDIFDRYLLPRLYVISGWSSMGKNIVADNLVHDLCLRYPGLYLSFDNSSEETAMSIMSISGGVEYKNIEEGKLDKYDIEQLEERKKIGSNLLICDKKMPARAIRNTLRKAVKNHGIRWYLLDYFTNIPLPRNGDTTRQYEDAALELKHTSHELKIPGIILSQLNNDGELKWCKGLFQEAYYVIKMEGERGTNVRKVTIDKYKKGALRQVNIEYNAPKGVLSYARDY